VRLAALLVPVAVAILTAVLLARLLPAAEGSARGWRGGSPSSAARPAALLLTDRLARACSARHLLELSLVFPTARRRGCGRRAP
jgi:hypothetical protein